MLNSGAVYCYYCQLCALKDAVVKQNLIRTIDLIGKALHPDHLKSNEFIFNKRGDLINHLLVRPNRV